MLTPEPASSAAPGLSTRSTELSAEQRAAIARQRGHVAFAVLLSIGSLLAVMVDEAGRWTEATPLGFTLRASGTVAVHQDSPAEVSTLKQRFPRLVVTTVTGQRLWHRPPFSMRAGEGVVVDSKGEVWRRASMPAVELRFFASGNVLYGGTFNECSEDQSGDDRLFTPDERAACTSDGRSVVFGSSTTTASTRLVRIPGGGTTLWAGVLVSALLAALVGAAVRRFSRRGPDDDEGREALRRRSIVAVVLAVGLAVPLLAHAGFMVVAETEGLVSWYAAAALIATGLPHLLMLVHLRRSATAWLAGTFTTSPVSVAMVVAAVIPGIVLLVPTVTVLVVAVVLHLVLRRWARGALAQDDT
jgi:hypothetical protein